MNKAIYLSFQLVRTHLASAMLVALVALALSSPAFCQHASRDLCGEIHDAAKQGDLAKIQTLLKGHPDLVFSKDQLGYTPLYVAARYDRTDVAKLLLANGADVNSRTVAKDNADDDGMDDWTPLHEAAYWGYKDVVKLLRQHGGH